MTIKQQGGVFGRNPTFQDVSVDGALDLPDGVKASFGTSDDLQIFHSGTNSFIQDLGTGSLYIQSAPSVLIGSVAQTNLIVADGGAVTIRHNGLNKLATTAAGVSVTGNVAVTDGGGIDFSATSGTGTSELFDDYEEGTWTPEITAATVGDLAVTYSVQTGLYTKIGRTVTAYASITTSSFTHSTASGIASVANLPFTVGQRGVGALVFEGITKTGFTSFLSVPNAGTTDAQLFASRSGGTTSTVKITEMPSGGTVFLQFTVTYTV